MSRTAQPAALFDPAEDVLNHVLDRVRPEHRAVLVPPLLDRPGYDRPTPVSAAVRRHVRDAALIPGLLAGRTVADTVATAPPPDGDGAGNEGSARAAVSAAARTAVAAATTPVVHLPDGDVDLPGYLWQLVLLRCFLAHEVAVHLGSVCPLTEELARAVWEGTAPDAAHWRTAGWFGAPQPLPPDVSWRDRFLLTAGRDPHPLWDR